MDGEGSVRPSTLQSAPRGRDRIHLAEPRTAWLNIHIFTSCKGTRAIAHSPMDRRKTSNVAYRNIGIQRPVCPARRLKTPHKPSAHCKQESSNTCSWQVYRPAKRGPKHTEDVTHSAHHVHNSQTKRHNQTRPLSPSGDVVPAPRPSAPLPSPSPRRKTPPGTRSGRPAAATSGEPRA